MNGRPVRFLPDQRQHVVVQVPAHPDAADRHGHRAVLRGVRRQFVQHQGHALRAGRMQEHARAGRGEPPDVAATVRREFLVEELAEVGALPAGFRQEAVRGRERLDATLDLGNVVVDRVRPRQPDDRLRDCEQIARAMIDLPGQQRVAGLGFLEVGDVDGDAAHTLDASPGVEGLGGGTDAPAHLPGRPDDPGLGLERLVLAVVVRHDGADSRKIIGVDQRPDAVDPHFDGAGSDAEDAVLAVIPLAFAARDIPLPGAHLAGREREAARPLALHQARVGGFELGGAFRDAIFQTAIELLELLGLAVELGEDLDLGAQHLRNDRHRHVVHGAHLVAAHQIAVGELDRRNEDDRGLLEARMLADHRGELEAVELRHADVDQQDRHVVAQQLIERLARRRRLDQVLVEILEDHLIGQQLGGLVVHQEDVDLIGFCHEPGRLPVQPHAQRGQ